MVSIVSSRTVRATQRQPVLEKKIMILEHFLCPYNIDIKYIIHILHVVTLYIVTDTYMLICTHIKVHLSICTYLYKIIYTGLGV